MLIVANLYQAPTIRRFNTWLQNTLRLLWYSSDPKGYRVLEIAVLFVTERNILPK